MEKRASFYLLVRLGTQYKNIRRQSLSSLILKKKHHAGQAFWIAANSLYQSKSPLGDYYRRIKSKAGAAKAVGGPARKLAIIYYKMVANKEAFNIKVLEDYQQKYKEKKINQLKKKLALLEAAEKLSFIRE